MNAEVHGHEILERLIAAGGTMPLSALKAAASRDFGEDARYYTCSARGMTFDGLIGFLLQRSKVAIGDEMVTVRAENMCRDGDHHDHG